MTTNKPINKVNTDIDIDFADKDSALNGLMYIPAAIQLGGDRKKHPSGVYFQNIPSDPIDGCATLEYETAEKLGFFKIDFLNNSIYADVRDEDHLIELAETEPDWSLFEHVEIVEDLAHIGRHFGIVSAIKPKSVEDLAVILALMRPGKRHLAYRPRHEIDAEVWTPSTDGFIFKRAHAIAYAVSIIVQLNIMCEKVKDTLDDDNNDGTSADKYITIC